MCSQQFNEPFFNRAGFVAAESGWSETVSEAELMFQAERLQPCFYVQDAKEFNKMRKGLVSRGYTVSDAMSVMEMRSPSFDANHEVAAELTQSEAVEEWCRAYLLSFYDDTKLLDPTLRIMRKVAKMEEVVLVSAKYRGATVGVLALHRSGRTTGVYCVGVVPHYRRMGIAATMMRFAHEFSGKADSQLILQTMLSDEVEGHYTKMGFTRCYIKTVFVKPVRRQTRLA